MIINFIKSHQINDAGKTKEGQREERWKELGCVMRRVMRVCQCLTVNTITLYCRHILIKMLKVKVRKEAIL